MNDLVGDFVGDLGDKIKDCMQQFYPMQELYQLFCQRVDRANYLTSFTISSNLLKGFRQEEHQRNEKERTILSYLKNRKTFSPETKIVCYTYSDRIMQKVYPDFVHIRDEQKLIDNFIGEFVALYQNFFEQIQTKFTFKFKIKSLIRPTNHHLISDLVKYLCDFSKDYAQHILLWELKHQQKQTATISNGPINPEFDLDLDLDFNLDAPPQSEIESGVLQIRQTDSQLRAAKSSLQVVDRKRTNENRRSQQIVKTTGKADLANLMRNYNMLQVNDFPSNLVTLEKEASNHEVLKFRINQLYKQTKSRNGVIRATYFQYLNGYTNVSSNTAEKEKEKEKKKFVIKGALDRVCFPFRIFLECEGNGSWINVEVSKINFQTLKDKSMERSERRYSPSSKVVKAESLPKSTTDMFINSLKILKFSQGFLPQIQHKPKTSLSGQKNKLNSKQDLTFRPIVQSRNNLPTDSFQKINIFRCYNRESMQVNRESLQMIAEKGEIKMSFDSTRLINMKNQLNKNRKKANKVSSVDTQRLKNNDLHQKLKFMKDVEIRKLVGILN